jgi:hypothetical protein
MRKLSEPLIPMIKKISMIYNFKPCASNHDHHYIIPISGSDGFNKDAYNMTEPLRNYTDFERGYC